MFLLIRRYWRWGLMLNIEMSRKAVMALLTSYDGLCQRNLLLCGLNLTKEKLTNHLLHNSKHKITIGIIMHIYYRYTSPPLSTAWALLNRLYLVSEKRSFRQVSLIANIGHITIKKAPQFIKLSRYMKRAGTLTNQVANSQAGAI